MIVIPSEARDLLFAGLAKTVDSRPQVHDNLPCRKCGADTPVRVCFTTETQNAPDDLWEGWRRFAPSDWQPTNNLIASALPLRPRSGLTKRYNMPRMRVWAATCYHLPASTLTMPPSLTLGDFKLVRAVCELRYEPAYLIYDRTGQVVEDIRNSFKHFRVLEASPNQSSFQSDEGGFALELNQSRFSSSTPDNRLEGFATHCKRYFDAVADRLQIGLYTRVGLRVMLRMAHKGIEESTLALRSLKLVNLASTVRYGASSDPNEVLLRWESDQVGTMLRLKAETGKIDLVLPPELEEPKSEIHKEINGLLVDVDYYTVAPVSRDQWDANSWIPQSFRVLRRDTDKILEG